MFLALAYYLFPLVRRVFGRLTVQNDGEAVGGEVNSGAVAGLHELGGLQGNVFQLELGTKVHPSLHFGTISEYSWCCLCCFTHNPPEIHVIN
jgi:hypothetical protein